MGSQYERQLIINLLNAKNDDVITRGSKALADKFFTSRGRKTPILSIRDKGALPAELGDRLRELNDCRSRLYLFGHGSRTKQHIAGLTANQVFDVLKDSWPADVRVTRVSLIACRLMGGQFQADATRITGYVRDSFASRFFELLGPTRLSSLTARIHSMIVVDQAARLAGEPIWNQNHAQGSKRTTPSTSKDISKQVNTSVNHGEKSKVLFSWSGQTVKCKFYDYNRVKVIPDKLPDLPSDADDIAGLADDPFDGVDYRDNPLL